LPGNNDVLATGGRWGGNIRHLTVVGCVNHGQLMGAGKPFHGDLGGLILVIINIGDFQTDGDIIRGIGRHGHGDKIRGKRFAGTHAGHGVAV